MASAAAEEKTESAAPAGGAAPAAPAGGGNKLVMILTLVNTVVTVAIVAILLVSLKQQKTPPAATDIEAHGEGHGEGGAEHGAAKEGEHGAAAGGHGEAKKDDGHGGKTAAKPPVEIGKMVTLEQFTVNLSTPGATGSKFVRVNVSLEVPNADAEAEVNGKMPQIRNVIIDLFNSKRASDLSSAEGRDYLREEIRNALNGFLVSGKVKGVFFTNFMLSG